MSINKTLKLSLLGLLGWTASCTPAPANPCGNGTYAETSTARGVQQYCGYANEVVVVSGFSCPDGFPFSVNLPNGSRICSNREVTLTTSFPTALCSVVGCSVDGGTDVGDGGVCLTGSAPTCIQGCGDVVLAALCTATGWECPEGTTPREECDCVGRPPGSDCVCSGTGINARYVCNTCSSVDPRPVTQNITFRFPDLDFGSHIIDPNTAERCDGFTLVRNPNDLPQAVSLSLPDQILCEGPGPRDGQWDLALVGRDAVDIVWPAAELLTCSIYQQCPEDRVATALNGQTSGLTPGSYRATFYLRNSTCTSEAPCSRREPQRGLCESGDGSVSVDFVLPESGDIVVEVPLTR